MSTAKVIEVISEGATIEGAIQNAVTDASKTLHNITNVWVEGIKAQVTDGVVSNYRINAKITFVLD